jgi:hypothetical protein
MVVVGQPDWTTFQRRTEVRDGGYVAMRFLNFTQLTADGPTGEGGGILSVFDGYATALSNHLFFICFSLMSSRCE